MVPTVVIGGVSSGVGKTTVTAGIIAALRRRGLTVQPFKAGPDYIDPGYLTAAAGRPARNLDGWLIPPGRLAWVFDRACRGADLAVVEGVMGFFDGKSGLDDAGSTAQVARIFNAPAVIVIDVRAMARSAAAVALGFARLDPTVRIAGFILNRVGSPRHLEWTRQAIEAATGLPVLGGLPEDPDLAVPERHLGLMTAAERDEVDDLIGRLGARVAESVDLKRLLELARQAGPLPAPEPVAPSGPHRRVRIGVARDRAFSFYYEDNLDLLRELGAELVEFSPLADPDLPDVDGLYLGGGFPELYAAGLAANGPLRAAVRRAVAAGMPVYAECGGLMYLADGIRDFAGQTHPMVGVIPGVAAMGGGRVRLGYLEVETLRPSAIGPAGRRLRGHEFHASDFPSPPPDQALYRVLNQPGRLEGRAVKNVVASYLHVHFVGCPEVAADFVRCCAGEGPADR